MLPLRYRNREMPAVIAIVFSDRINKTGTEKPSLINNIRLGFLIVLLDCEVFGNFFV